MERQTERAEGDAMHDDLDEIHRRLGAGERLAVATVVRTWRSAPRPAGATMAVTESGQVIGSISGGCVEGAVYATAEEVLAQGRPQRCEFGVSDDDAFSVGLVCGGTIEVLVEPASAATWGHLSAVRSARGGGRPMVLATVVDGDSSGHLVVEADVTTGSLGSPALDAAAVREARTRLTGGVAGLVELDDAIVFLQPFMPPPSLLVLGAVDFAAALCQIGRLLGHRVTVCDARALFATRARFPDAHEVVVDWPHRFLGRCSIDDRTAICVLTHDRKYDVPALEIALRSDAGFVGAMGSRRTHDVRLGHLREAGLTEVELARLRSPIGLDLGASTPEETAVAIVAEIIAARTGASARPLREGEGPIHRVAATV